MKFETIIFFLSLSFLNDLICFILFNYKLTPFQKFFFSFFFLSFFFFLFFSFFFSLFSHVGLMSTSFYSGTALSRSVAEEALHFGGMDPLPLPITASLKSRGGSSSSTTRKKSPTQKTKKIKSRTKNNGGAFLKIFLLFLEYCTITYSLSNLYIYIYFT